MWPSHTKVIDDVWASKLEPLRFVLKAEDQA